MPRQPPHFSDWGTHCAPVRKHRLLPCSHLTTWEGASWLAMHYLLEVEWPELYRGAERLRVAGTFAVGVWTLWSVRRPERTPIATVVLLDELPWCARP